MDKDNEDNNLHELAASCGAYLERGLQEQAVVDAYTSACSFLGIPRCQFSDLHFRYKPVPEIYLSKATFDEFFPPRSYLSQLRQEHEDTELALFLEALGCHIIPDKRQREELSSKLSQKLPMPGPDQGQGLVLICWERIHNAPAQLGLEGHWSLALLYAVSFHEHSHAARQSRLLTPPDQVILSKEETIAQEEAYMFLRSRNHRGAKDAIEAMERLMQHQPECYRIRIP